VRGALVVGKQRMMIAVIADDLTGAAEIGAIGLRHGIAAEVQTEFDPRSDADLIVIDTGTRSSRPSEAAATIERVVKQVLRCRPELLFKKVDSVLRGPVLAELAALRRAAGAREVLLVPANPSLGRVIRDGRYYVNKVPIHLTSFAGDPEHPARSSDVIEMLGRGTDSEVIVRSLAEPAADAEIVVGEAARESDLSRWTRRIGVATVPAGAAGFFRAILQSKGFRERERSAASAPTGARKTLFVCGSMSESSLSRLVAAEANGIAVVRMPAGLLEQPDARGLVNKWASAASNALARKDKAVLTIGRSRCGEAGMPVMLGRYLAEASEAVLRITRVDLVCVDGGSTASALVRRIGWRRLAVCAEHAPGVVEMRVVSGDWPAIVTRPGSYAWDWPERK